MQVNSGYTFVEVLTIIAVSALLITSLTGLVGRSIHISRDQSQQVRTTDEARKQLERTSNVIRSSQNVTINNQVKGWLVSGDNFSLTFYSNVDSDPAIEKVHYYVDSSDPTTIKQEIIKPDSNGDYTGTPDITELTHSLRNQMPDQALFYYKDKDGSVLGTPLSSDDLSKVVTVGMAWRIDADPATDPPAQDIGTEVTPRQNDQATATNPAILAPINLAGSNPTNNTIDWSWEDPNTVPPTGYNLYDASTNPPTFITTMPAALTYTETGLSPGTSYSRVVTAVYNNGQSGPSNEATVATLGAIGTPVPPVMSCTADSPNDITCSWPTPNPSDPPVAEWEIDDPVPTPNGAPVPLGPLVDNPNDPTPTPNGGPIPTPDPGPIKTRETGLKPDTDYLRTVTSIGTDGVKSNPSAPVAVHTKPCTIGGVTGVNPSPTPSPTGQPNISPVPARYDAGSAPCFTVGLSVVSVFRVDPLSEAIQDRSAEYHWKVKAAGANNNQQNVFDGGTPSAFTQYEVVQGTPYVIWLTRVTPGVANGTEECTYLTEPGHSAPDGNNPQPITIGGGQGASNYKLAFYYMPLRQANLQNPDRNYTCKVFENQGAEIRPQLTMLQMPKVFGRNLANGVITEASPNWSYRNSNVAMSSGYVGYDVFPMVPEDEYQIFMSVPACNQLTANSPLHLPLSKPYPHFFTTLHYTYDFVINGLNVVTGNCKLIETWTGNVLRSGVPIPTPTPVPKYNVKLASVLVNGHSQIWDWSICSPVGSNNCYSAISPDGSLLVPAGTYALFTAPRPGAGGYDFRGPANQRSCATQFVLNADKTINLVVTAVPWPSTPGYVTISSCTFS